MSFKSMKVLKPLLFLGFLSVFFISYLTPITEGDFFYHLGVGKAVIEGKGRPEVFGQTLGQVILYGIWSLFGPSGIVLLRAGLYTGVLALLYLWMMDMGVGFYGRVFFLLIPAHMFLSFPSERPQIFGFVFSPLLIYLLEKWRSDKKVHYVYFVPLMLIIWAGTHPTFVLGLTAVWIYLIVGVISALSNKKPLTPFLPLAIAAVLPLAVFFFIPNFIAFLWQAIEAFINPAPYMKSIQEYLSPVAAFKIGVTAPAYWLFLTISIYLISYKARRMSPEHIVLLAVFGLLPFKGIRFLPFFTSLSPIAASYFSARRESLDKSKVLFAGFLAVLFLWAVFIPRNISIGVSRQFPADAVSFFKAVKPAGKVFNYQGWAGYLNWSLPETEIFMPTAGISADTDEAYEKIIWAANSFAFGKPEWRALLDAYRLDVIFMPAASPVSGEIYTLTDAIQKDNEWFLIYQDRTANIFVRATASNARLIERYMRPKSDAYLQAIEQAKELIKKHYGDRAAWRLMGEAYLRVGETERAQEAFKKSQGL